LKPGRMVAIAMSAIVLLYVMAIFIGLRVQHLSLDWWDSQAGATAWQPPSLASIPNDKHGDSIRRGASIFNETPLYASEYTSSKISCSNCHAGGGIQPYASPMVGLPKLFPMFNERAGHVISMKDRIQECFVRSENGKPIDYNGETMMNLVDYINWLSQPEPEHKAFQGRGLVKIPVLVSDSVRGRQIYTTQCAGCHGNDGQGRAPMFPAVWGPNSFNDGAGMNNVDKMAAFVQHNMPQNRMGILTPQEAYDVSAFIHAQSRPAFNQAYKKY
jgi:thiosulfate dehydrogenase